MAFDLSFLTRTKCNEDAAANQIHQKNAGTAGTTGTAFIHAGLRVPKTVEITGDKRGQTRKPEQNGQAGQHESGTVAGANAGDSGNLSPVSPSVPSVLGTKKPSVYAGVPSVPHVPSKKASNPNEAAKAQSNDPPPVSPHAARVAELAGAAYLHHFACKHCQAAGRGLSFAYMRCDTGRELWEAYQDAIE
jgi:hypothetical protein